jgi:stage V sporulation protein K
MSDKSKSSPAGNTVTPADRIMSEIREMVGLKNIKEQLDQLVAFGELIKLRRERDIPMDRIGLHMVFTGSPGTGKTVLARKFGELFKAIGLLRDGRLVEVDRSTLVGDVVGDSEKKTRDAFERARNGVLFIDEAYSLGGISAEDVTKDVSDPYGKAAIDTLMKLMEDNRSSVAIIVAGYRDPMARFLQRNLGLKSRFAKHFHFPSYEPKQLLEIFQSMATASNYTVEPDAMTEARRFMETWDIEAKDFGNAREVRTFLEAMLPVQAVRIANTPNFRNLSNEELLTISLADVLGAKELYGSRL